MVSVCRGIKDVVSEGQAMLQYFVTSSGATNVWNWRPKVQNQDTKLGINIQTVKDEMPQLDVVMH